MIHWVIHNAIYMPISMCVVRMCSITVLTVAVTASSFTKLSNMQQSA
jgi:hypothetical protein